MKYEILCTKAKQPIKIPNSLRILIRRKRSFIRKIFESGLRKRIKRSIVSAILPKLLLISGKARKKRLPKAKKSINFFQKKMYFPRRTKNSSCIRNSITTRGSRSLRKYIIIVYSFGFSSLCLHFSLFF